MPEELVFQDAAAAEYDRAFALGDAAQLQALFDKAGRSDCVTNTPTHTFVLPSFDAYYGPFDRGGAATGQAPAALSEETRSAISEEVRRMTVKAAAEYRIASGRG